MFSVENTKRLGDFSDILRSNKAQEVSYNFKAALDYSSLYRSIYFWCHDTTLKTILSIEKLSSTWNKQTNFKKLCPLSPLKVWKI